MSRRQITDKEITQIRHVGNWLTAKIYMVEVFLLSLGRLGHVSKQASEKLEAVKDNRSRMDRPVETTADVRSILQELSRVLDFVSVDLERNLSGIDISVLKGQLFSLDDSSPMHSQAWAQSFGNT